MVANGIGDWVFALLVVGGSLVVGVALDAVIVGLLNRQTGPALRPRRAIAKAFRGQSEVWAVLVGLAMSRPFAFLASQTQWWVERAVIVLAVLSVTLFFARLAGSLIRAYLSQESVSAPSGTIFVNLARIMIWAVGLTVMLGALQVQVGPLIASLGVVGIAVSLGLQDTLANFFAGLQVTISRQIQPGQYIRLATTQEGLVTDVTWRNTTLLAPGNDMVIIPNSVVANSLITNYSAADEEHIEAISFTVAFGSDLEAVKDTALKVARQVCATHPEAVDEYDPICRFRAFGPEGISAVVTIRVTRFQDRLEVVSDLVEGLHRELAETGVSFGTGISVTQKPLA